MIAKDKIDDNNWYIAINKGFLDFEGSIIETSDKIITKTIAIIKIKMNVNITRTFQPKSHLIRPFVITPLFFSDSIAPKFLSIIKKLNKEYLVVRYINKIYKNIVIKNEIKIIK